MLAGILHLGNITFEQGKTEASLTTIASPASVRSACHLLKLPQAALVTALLKVKTAVRGEVVEASKRPAQALADLEILLQRLTKRE